MSSGSFVYDVLIFLFRHGTSLIGFIVFYLFASYVYKNRVRARDKDAEVKAEAQSASDKKSSVKDALLAEVAKREKQAKEKTVAQAPVKSKAKRKKGTEKKTAQRDAVVQSTISTALAQPATDWSVYDTPAFLRKGNL